MYRREALARLLAVGAVISFRSVFAQSSQPVSRRVALVSATPKENAHIQRGICAQLGDMGWIEGKSINYDWRIAADQDDRLPRMIQDLLGLQPDVLFVRGNIVARAAMQLTRSVPIVMAFALDPVGSGFAKSLPRPGGNVTGVIWADPQVAGKIVELIREVAPSARRLALIFDTRLPGMRPYVEADRLAATALGIEFREYGVNDAESLGATLDSLKRDNISAIKAVFAGAIQGPGLRRLLEESGKHRIPVVSTTSFAAEQGAVLTYSPLDGEVARIAARQIDKILRGAKPAETPFEYATRMEIIVNVRAAKELGIAVPSSTLLRADRVIE